MAIVFFYATLGGMKGITYTQVAQYGVLIVAYLVPAFFIAFMLTGNPIPSSATAGRCPSGAAILGAPVGAPPRRARQGQVDLGFPSTPPAAAPLLDVFAITFTMMVGTAGLPHIISRFFTVPKIRDARASAGWALVFITILYTTAPAVAVFAATNFIQTVNNKPYADAPAWFKDWEKTKLVGWTDRTATGSCSYRRDPEVERASRRPRHHGARQPGDRQAAGLGGGARGGRRPGRRALLGGRTAARHRVRRVARPHEGGAHARHERADELLWARAAAGGAVVIAGYFGINPPGFVAQVVAFAFGLAASSFFPTIVLGRLLEAGHEGGRHRRHDLRHRLHRLVHRLLQVRSPRAQRAKHWWFGISPEGIGMIGMMVNFAVTVVVTMFTKPPPRPSRTWSAGSATPRSPTTPRPGPRQVPEAMHERLPSGAAAFAFPGAILPHGRHRPRRLRPRHPALRRAARRTLFDPPPGRSRSGYYPAGTGLVRAGGEPLGHLYVIRKGAVRLEREGQSLQVLEEGETFGYTSLITGKATLDVVVEDDLLAYRLPARGFRALLADARFAGHFAVGSPRGSGRASSTRRSPPSRRTSGSRSASCCAAGRLGGRAGDGGRGGRVMRDERDLLGPGAERPARHRHRPRPAQPGAGARGSGRTRRWTERLSRPLRTVGRPRRCTRPGGCCSTPASTTSRSCAAGRWSASSPRRICSSTRPRGRWRCSGGSSGCPRDALAGTRGSRRDGRGAPRRRARRASSRGSWRG